MRLARRDVWAMPPEDTNEVDDVGVASVRAWIAAMPCGAACTSALAP